ncbi:MAG TPA: tetratricopeptide repeat protein [Candidatus Omnitrophota bacterium]|nr:tetratricopeptide repeat protein [Candidatus Omnitrophota bacterium]
MKPSVFVLSVYFVFASVCGVQAVFAQTEDQELFATAQRAYDDGFHDVAIRYLEQYTDKFPQGSKIDQSKFLLGQSYYFKNQFAKALELFKSLNPMAEGKDALLFWIAETYLKLANFPSARECYQDLISHDPDSAYIPQALYSLGWSYFDQKDHTKARETFGQLIQRFPKHQLAEDSLLKVAESFFNEGDYAKALQVFQQHAAVYPQSPRALEVALNIADAYYYSEKYDQAAPYYEQAAKSQDPVLALRGLTGKVWCDIKRGRYETAERSLKEGRDFAKTKGLSEEDLLVASGHLSYERGDWDKAVEAYSGLIKDFTSLTQRLDAYLGRANAYFMLRAFPKALEDFKYVVDHARRPDDTQLSEKAQLGLAWAYVKMGDLDTAVKIFRALAADAAKTQTKANAMVQLADAAQDAGKMEEAVHAYDEVLRDYPDQDFSDYALYRQGIAFLKSDRVESAMLSFNTLRNNFPNSKFLVELHYYHGVADFKGGRLKAAIDGMESFLKNLSQPSDFAPEANYILALSYLNLKQPEDALRVFQKILRLYPDEEIVAKNSDIGIAKCQYELGQIKEAVKRFKIIIYKYPKSDVEFEALLWLAQYYLKNGDYAGAVEYYKPIMDRFPDDPAIDQVHYELGQAYEVQGAYDLALAQYKAVVSQDPVLSSKIKLAIAGIFAREFDAPKGLAAYASIAATMPDYARDAYLKMGQIHRASQNYPEELRTYEQALKRPQGKSRVTNAEFLFNMADTCELMGEDDKAVDHYLKIPLDSPRESEWVVKAYLRVAKVFEDRQDWAGAKVTYQKIIQLKTDESAYAQERLDWIGKREISR